MTTTPPAAPATPPEPTETQPSSTPEGTTPPEPNESPEKERRQRNLNSEAAQRRTQLRDVEAERDTLRERLVKSQRQNVEHLLTSGTNLRGDGEAPRGLNRVADLWEVLGGTVEQFHDDDGNLDQTALAEFIEAGTADREYLLKPARFTGLTAAAAAAAMAPRGGLTNVGTGRPSWGSALNPNQP